MRPKRTRREMAFDRNKHYNGLEKADISRKAKENFKRGAYQARRMVTAQGEQMKHKTVAEYYAEKYGIEEEKDGVSESTDTGAGAGRC